jgi:maltooligosyltrehalose trehalohydrolase
VSAAGNFGARYNGDGTTTFRLWAPDVEAVRVEIAGGESVAMARDEDGVFAATVQAGVGTHYRYRVAGDVTAPDPASRAQHGDVDDDSVVVDPQFSWDYPDWQGRPWTEAVIYELHVGAFGGYAGVTQQLPRLAALGITAIELMPVAEFPGRHSWGYDGVLHYAPDAAYGTPDELKCLIDSAHGLGLMVFLDVVYNHFGPAGNYLNAYAKSFFREDIHTPWGSAIDFRRPQVRRFYIENALYWLNDFRFDGLRFDAVSMIKDPTFLLEMSTEIKASAAQAGRHIHLIVENENNESSILSQAGGDGKFDGQWTDDWHHCMHVLLTGETEGYYEDYDHAAQMLARCMAEGFGYQGEFSKHAKKPRGEISGQLPTSSFIIFLQNHDQIGNRAFGERLTTLVPAEKLRAAVLLLLLTPQIPMVFMGEEWGETKPFLFFTDHNDDLAEMIREGRRSEFGHFTAFKDPEMRDKIPDPNAHATFTAAVPQLPIAPTEEQLAMQGLFTFALQLRAKEIMPRLAATTSLGAAPLGSTGVRASWRMGDGAILTLAANFGGTELPCEPGPGALLLSAGAGPMTEGKLPPASAFAWLQAHESNQ